jgi:hypothetical protein
MMPLFASVLASLLDPLLLRWHARWTRHAVMMRLRSLRLGSKR